MGNADIGSTPIPYEKISMQSQETWATVLPFTGVCQAFAYKVPAWAEVSEGYLVKIRLRSRICLGIVDRLLYSPPNFSTNEIEEVIYPLPVLSRELLNLGKWMANYYGQSYQSIFETFLPNGIREKRKLREKQYLTISSSLSEQALSTLKQRSPKQAMVYEFLKESPYKTIEELIKALGVSRSVILSLRDKGFISYNQVPEIVAEPMIRSSFVPELSLTEEQLQAFQGLCESLDQKQYATHLLFGITGSGKTEVYSRLTGRILQDFGSVLWLVPEIALTIPALEKIRLGFAKYNPVIWHSRLTEGERLKNWWNILEGKTRLVIGTRSALFLPLKELRLIVVDEEHEPAYKNGETPRYNGRDAAIYRAFLNKALCVLGSATPSLESWHNVQLGKYKVHYLKHRALGQGLPHMRIVDMRYEKPFCGALAFSTLLREKIAERLDNREQSILFLNRRGYASYIQCKTCGHVVYCPSCHVTLVYHRGENLLKCHLCGKIVPMLHDCPVCHDHKLRPKGIGTQRLEDIIAKIFPMARTARIDVDSASDYEQSGWLELVKNNTVDILIGTQMIAKGLDFPNVTLVGVLNADAALHVSDFRAEERTFQLLVQVAGRSGRSHKPSEVVVQTFSPQNEYILRSKDFDVEGFLKSQLELRKDFHYPPYRHIIRHLFKGRSREKVWFFTEQWGLFLSKNFREKYEFHGPVWAPKEKVNDFYRCSIFFFAKNILNVLPKLLELRDKFKLAPDIVDTFDVDPVDFS